MVVCDDITRGCWRMRQRVAQGGAEGGIIRGGGSMHITREIR